MALKRPAIAAVLLLALTVGAPGAVRAQTPTIDFSGVIFTNFQTRSDSTAKALNGGNNSSKFDVERVYLTFRMPAGEKFSIRATTEVFNNNDASTNAFYKGWAMRFKYAYLQWAFANDLFGATGLNATARIGMLHNVVIDHEESFWPRYLSQVALERTASMFNSADVGAALLVTLPKKIGEVYGTVVNGTGFGSSENDRFKDFAARLTITPLANSSMGAIPKSLAISPWIYAGHTASKFQNGGTGQVGPVPEGLEKSRRGVFVGVKDPRLTLGVSLAQRTETVEGPGENTAASPRTTSDVTGNLTSFFGVVRPGAWFKPGTAIAKLGVLGRMDTFQPNTDNEPKNQFTILSLFYDVTPKVTFSLDVQELSRKNSSVVPQTKTLFFHVQALF